MGMMDVLQHQRVAMLMANIAPVQRVFAPVIAKALGVLVALRLPQLQWDLLRQSQPRCQLLHPQDRIVSLLMTWLWRMVRLSL